MPRTEKTRQKIIDNCAKIFYKNGYRATGVDALAKASGVTKATLYHHFKDKNQLIEEALKYLSDLHRRNYMEAWSRKGLAPIDKLTILFDEMDSFFKEDDCYGCPFINAAGEFTNRQEPVRRICEQHYAFLTSHLEQFAREAMLKKPDQIAAQISSIIAGAYTAWFVGGNLTAAKQGKQIALALIANHR